MQVIQQPKISLFKNGLHRSSNIRVLFAHGLVRPAGISQIAPQGKAKNNWPSTGVSPSSCQVIYPGPVRWWQKYSRPSV